MARYYGLGLCDLGRRRLPWRRLRSLVAHLPPESATISALAPTIPVTGGSEGPPRQWSGVEHRVVDVLDAVRSMHHTLIQVNSKSKVPAPEPIERPTFGEAVATPRRGLTAEQRARIRRRNHGEEVS